MYVKITVYPGSKTEELRQLSTDSFEVKIRTKAERNMANNHLREMLASHFKLPVGKIRIISGHHHPHKIVNIDI
ncbi:MAG: DUF167 domain-containing protein [Patescibacteria group bacterium]